jgi:hypothetical protein
MQPSCILNSCKLPSQHFVHTRHLVHVHSQHPRPLLLQATKEVEGLVFQLASSLTQLKKLVDMLGGAKDTVEHRHKIGEVNQKIQNAAKQVKQQMTGLHAEKETLSEAEQLKTKKLLQDFTVILQVHSSCSRPVLASK